MRIATLTWFTGNNYGSTMQSYALQAFLKKHGFESDILAYSPPKTKNLRLKILNHSVKATLEYKANELYVKLRGTGAQNNLHLFNEFRNKNMTFSESCSTRAEIAAMNDKYDAFVCGSDQIWNPFYFDPVYALEFVDGNRRKIAYAPSFGTNEISKKSAARMKKPISSINYLSVRELNGVQLIQKLTGREAIQVSDPVMLLNRKDWEHLATNFNDEHPYILCYFLRKNKSFHNFALQMSNKLDCGIKLIPMVMGDFKKPQVIKEPVGPEEWLGLIKNARMVVTDSFHCTLFSIIFRKDFAVFKAFRDEDKRSQNSRIDCLLETTGLTDRIINNCNELLGNISSEQFDRAEDILLQQAKRSAEWLLKAIGGPEET